jgi:hypothetical protein
MTDIECDEDIRDAFPPAPRVDCSRKSRGCKNSLPAYSPNVRCDSCRMKSGQAKAQRRRRINTVPRHYRVIIYSTPFLCPMFTILCCLLEFDFSFLIFTSPHHSCLLLDPHHLVTCHSQPRRPHPLKSLDIANNQFGPDAVEFIANGLENNRFLTALDISMNEISKEGANSISRALRTNSTLQTLYLCDNWILNGAIKLANALKTNSSLHTMILCRNGINDDGATSFSEALMINTTLTNLNLGRNGITNVGAKKLADALMTNSDLKILDLQRNMLSPERDVALFAETLIVNKTLDVILWVDVNKPYRWPTMGNAWTF